MTTQSEEFSWSEDRQDIESFLSLQPSEVKQNCAIVSAQEFGQDFMLRIDKHPPEKFVPNMPKSAMPTENTNTPRITVAPALIGCMIGYFRVERDVQDGTHPDAKGNVKFAGGYSISKMPFTHCLRPNGQMVGDADNSNEHWLVPYSIESVEYDPDIIGQLFVGSVTYLPVSGHWPGVRLEMYLSVTKDVEIQLLPNRKVGMGYWRFTVYWPNIRTRSVQDEKCLLGVESIEMSVYAQAKKLKADMLSHEDKLPGFGGW